MPASEKHLINAFIGSRILETLENYSPDTRLKVSPAERPPEEDHFASSREFWEAVLAQPDVWYEKSILLNSFSISSWVPRIPGFYWTEGGRFLRNFSIGNAELVGTSFMHYNPHGKSAIVMGGVGTLKFAPEDGYQMICLTSDRNASTGIPALVSKDVVNKCSLEDGMMVDVKGANWVAMKENWAHRFPFTRGIPRACLLIDDAKKIDIKKGKELVEYHPFTIMQYTEGDGLFYSYVYCTVTSGRDNPDEVADFFEYYRTAYGRNGEYLIAADPLGKLFPAIYASRAELLKNDADGQTMLDMLSLRIRGAYYDRLTLDTIIKKLTSLYTTSGDIKRLATYLHLPLGELREGKTGVMINQLVLLCEKYHKLETLVEKVTLENKYAFLES